MGSDRCLHCLVSTEKVVEEGKVSSIPYPARYWFDIVISENEFIQKLFLELKPKTFLEVGCGPGRIIQKALETGLEFDRVIGIEGVKVIKDYASNRFKFFPNISIMHKHVKKSLPFKDNYFDLGICAMNTLGWQEDPFPFLCEMLRCCHKVFFTVYKKGKEKERKGMYESRGHKVEYTEDGQIILKGCDLVSEVITRSFAKQELESLCSPFNYEIMDVSEFMWGVLLYK